MYLKLDRPPALKLARLPEKAPPRPRRAPKPAAAPVRAPPRTWSIVLRLTGWYTLSALVMLSLATAFLYWLLSTSLREEDNQFLADEIESLRALLRDRPDDQAALKEEVELEGAARRYGRYYIRIISETSGRIVVQTDGIDKLLPGTNGFPRPAQIGEAVRPGARWRSAENKTFLLTAARAQLGVPSRNRRLIQFALEVSSEEAMLARYRKRIALVLGLGILGSSIAGIVIARREMRPLAEITRAAKHITATQLNERISPGAWPKELTELATAFDEMLSRLEESFTRLSQFSADLAHELRTPINNLMGEAEVALARGRTPAEYKLVLESSLEECGRLARMIDSLLFLARTDNAETEVQRTTFELRKETQAVLEFYEAVAEEQAVELSVTGQAMLSADVILFRRALSNLLTNAFKYTPRGGQIIVTIQLMSDATLAVSVADNGAGIGAEHLPRIFYRFYRADPSRSQHPQQGTGLGLAIVKSIMELHGGAVTVQSELGRGTVFTLWFPTNNTQFEI